MGRTSILRTLALTVGVMMAIGAGPARAGYEDEQNDLHLGVIERSLEKFVKDPAIFDGKAVKAGATVQAAVGHAKSCDDALSYFDRYYKQVSKKGQGSDRARKVVDRYNALVPWCNSLGEAVDAFVAAAKAAEKAAEKAAADRSKLCQELVGDTSDATGGRSNLYNLLDTWAGNRTPNNAETIKEFRTQLEQLGTVCSKAKYAAVSEQCRGVDHVQSSATNARYDLGDICVPAADPTRTLTEVTMRAAQPRASRTELPTTESFRSREGWLQTTDVVAYATYFQVDQSGKDKRTAEVTAMFVAAGIPTPADLSMLWADEQAYLDALKVAVDATASEWKLTDDKCKGYACKNAEKQIKKWQKKAKIKKVFGSSWKIVKNGIGVPTYRYMGMFVLYQLPGEPYCQVRSLTANEDYQGGGKYQKATGAQWGYVRFQKCK